MGEILLLITFIWVAFLGFWIVDKVDTFLNQDIFCMAEEGDSCQNEKKFNCGSMI